MIRSYPRGIHDGPFSRPSVKEDRMQFKTHISDTLDEVAVEIASILAKGYMRHQTGRRLPSDSMDSENKEAKLIESEAVTEKELDSSGHRSLHAFMS
jgi:hypothetical protein